MLCSLSTASAGIPAFSPGLIATTQVQDSTSTDTDGDYLTVVEAGPATSESLLTDRLATASADYTEFKNYALVASGAPSSPGSFAVSNAIARDLVTITVPGSPAGTTRLEMIWQVDGFISGDAAYDFDSRYALNSIDQPQIDAGGVYFDSPGSFNQSVTLTYDNVPLDTAWALRTNASAVADGDAIGEIDFSDTATLTGVVFYIDNVLTPADITGVSGTVYAVPEPTSLALLGLGGFAVLVHRCGRPIESKP